MKETSEEAIRQLLESQKQFFNSRQTKDINFRKEQLRNFRSAIKKYEKEICDALWKDLHKSYEEAYLTEVSIVLQELNTHLRNFKIWAKPEKVSTPIHLFPSRSRILYEPLGVALITAPWNYPFQLLMNPLIGAISSGCCAVLKTSPYAPATAEIMDKLITETFPPHYIGITHGGRNVNQLLWQQRFDIFFFTGSPALGKTVMKAASEHLIPVVLELGGKSPCIVDKNANLDRAAKRIIWGKTINAGQTCIAPDYLYVHHSVKEELLKKMEGYVTEMFGPDIKQSRYYPRIVSDQAMERLQKLLDKGHIVFGGDVDPAQKYISPTLIEGISVDDPVMQEEIFGPILPVLTFDRLDEVTGYLRTQEKPLAFYYFGKNKEAKEILSQTTSGGGCINDTLMHITNHHLPFGGVGNSGMGKYHGYESFRAFSNARSIVITPTWMDMPLKYVPFKNFKLTKKFL